MNHTVVNKRYANAFFLCLDQDLANAEKYVPGMESLVTLFENDDCRKIFSNPAIVKSFKISILAELLKKINADKVFEHFVFTVLDAGRIADLGGMAREFLDLINEKKGIAFAKLTTAVELDKKSRSNLQEFLENYFGKKLEIETVVDATLLGGFIVDLDNRRLDLSIASRLEQMATVMVS